MASDSNTVHLKFRSRDAVIRAYSAYLRRKGFRAKVPGSIPDYLETADENVFRRVLISKPTRGWITIVDQKFDDMSLRAIHVVLKALTLQLECRGVAFVMRDNQALYYAVCSRGETRDRYCSWPRWYNDGEPSARVRAYWQGNTRTLLRLCRKETSLRRLNEVVRDYSMSPQPVFAETILCELAELLGIENPIRTYAAYYPQRPPLYLAVPDFSGEGNVRRLRLDSAAPEKDSYWKNFEHLFFMRAG